MLDNPRQERFCQLYAVSNNAFSAYRGAGYAPKSDASAYNSASRLLGNDEIQARIAELTEAARLQAEKNSIADIVEVRQRVTQVLRGDCELETKAADVLKAADLLTRIGGQQEAPTVRVELSLADKAARLRELLDGSD